MAKRDDLITFNRPPSVDTVMTWVGRLARAEHFNEPLTGEEAHRAAAVFLAANFAMRRDLLSKAWTGQRHIAAKCGELFDRVTAMEAYRTSNRQFQVDFNFADRRAA